MRVISQNKQDTAQHDERNHLHPKRYIESWRGHKFYSGNIMNCHHCNMPLRDSIRIEGYKSCPRCSTTHGSEHVFHPDPSGFGQTRARVSRNNPDGIQSHCTECRHLDAGENSEVYQNYPTCSQINNHE